MGIYLAASWFGITARAPKVWPPLINSPSFTQTLTNQKSRTVSSWLLIGLNLHERMWINQKRSPCCKIFTTLTNTFASNKLILGNTWNRQVTIKPMNVYFEILHTMQCILMLTKSHGKIGDQMNDLQYQNSTILGSNALCSIKKSTLILKSYLLLFGCWEVNSIWLITSKLANQRCDWDFHSEWMWRMHNLCVLASINPLSANSDQKNFLLIMSIHCQEIKLWEFIKWSPKGKMPWSFIKSSRVILKKIYGDQFGEFVCGYWGLKG